MTLYTIMGESWFCWLVVGFFAVNTLVGLYELLTIITSEIINAMEAR